MKNVFLFIVCMFFTIVAVDAQHNKTNHSLSIGIESLKPLSKFSKVYSLGLGASVQENIGITKKTDAIIYAGYIRYFLKTSYGGGSDGFMPVRVGIEQTILHRFFGSAQLGITFRNHQLGNAFTFSAGVGVTLARSFSVLLKYVGQEKSAINSGAFGMRAAWAFGK